VTRPAHHPAPTIIASQLEALAKQLRANGDQAKLWALILSARGYPSATLGSGARSSDTTTSTERAVGLSGDDGPLTPPDAAWNGVDGELDRYLALLTHTASHVASLLTRLLAHASDDDPIPAGTGPCALRTCEHFCVPRKKPSDRLRRGLCPSHYNQWLLLGKPDLIGFGRMLAADVA
jgi:hypothetical protein